MPYLASTPLKNIIRLVQFFFAIKNMATMNNLVYAILYISEDKSLKWSIGGVQYVCLYI